LVRRPSEFVQPFQFRDFGVVPLRESLPKELREYGLYAGKSQPDHLRHTFKLKRFVGFAMGQVRGVRVNRWLQLFTAISAACSENTVSIATVNTASARGLH
jgi:hypothetical protein